MFITTLRRNMGTIIAGLGFFLLCIMTFGNLGELASDQYWKHVGENFTSIGFMSISLTLIQVAIKQGFAEQALQRGLNTENTLRKYEEHRSLIKQATERMIYLPYFLQIYNQRHTKLKRREFLINNNYTSENMLRASENKKLIDKYDEIVVHVTPGSIKWATTEIVYNKQGRILTLQEYRRRRTTKAVIGSLVLMMATVFLARGLFFTPSTEPLWQKFVKLFSYVLAIGVGSLLDVIKEYEKGAFGIPNDLEEINEIWLEFMAWTVPQSIIEEVDEMNKLEGEQNEQREENKDPVDVGADLSEKQETLEIVCTDSSDCVVSSSLSDGDIRLSGNEELNRKCIGDYEST